MNMNEQTQARRGEEKSEVRRTEGKMGQYDQGLTTRDLAGDNASKSVRVDDVARRDRDLSNGREMQGYEENSSTSLFETGEAESLRTRWSTIQTEFVDEPRRSVEQADELVATAMKRLAEIFANERDGLERNWDRGDDVSTEDLRIALQRYRSFFDRLLSV